MQLDRLGVRVDLGADVSPQRVTNSFGVKPFF